MFRSLSGDRSVRRLFLFIKKGKNFLGKLKTASPEMRTATYNVDAASGRRRRQNVM